MTGVAPWTVLEASTALGAGVELASFSFPLPHPPPPLGTNATVGSFPRFSLFKEGKLAGGGIRRLAATFPKLCKPCRVPDKQKMQPSPLFALVC